MGKTLFRSTHFWHFVTFEIEQYIFRWRWILPIPVTIFIAYIVTSQVLVNSANNKIPSNTWDVVFSVFGNGYILFFVLNVILIYLVSDLPIESLFGQLILIRLRSRKKWWLGKILTLALSVLMYLVVEVIVVIIVSSFVLPWQSVWSDAALTYPLEFYLNPQAITLSPISAFLHLLVLLALGWFSLGLATMSLTRLFNHSLAGFAFGLFLNVSGLIALKTYVPPPYVYLLVHYHFLFNLHTFSKSSLPYPTFASSVIYWVFWIVLFLFFGFVFCLPKDYISRELA